MAGSSLARGDRRRRSLVHVNDEAIASYLRVRIVEDLRRARAEGALAVNGRGDASSADQIRMVLKSMLAGAAVGERVPRSRGSLVEAVMHWQVVDQCDVYRACEAGCVKGMWATWLAYMEDKDTHQNTIWMICMSSASGPGGSRVYSSSSPPAPRDLRL
ncbi:hypothetical protein FIBSPDRAFT_267033 [Athelia psychrophila]|uniref:Uncharacterized protein n=1 Tax=Athelia psychrophila TaxID=1759441 RepID=A0A165X584_9AGAM|nr:hypothetical protein FIBSPDRAFT_267033 [Fibularhizoctonia sp. CBS 109695]